MSDDLLLPQVPETKPEDPEDVSWALSTAEAMWARGEHAEGIKWIRRAAEAASEADQDSRALELAKAAADLRGLVTKRVSRVSVDAEEIEPLAESFHPTSSSPPPLPKGGDSGRAPKVDEVRVPKPQPASVTKQVTTPSRPPAPLPSHGAAGRTSQLPRPATATPNKPLAASSKTAALRPTPAKTPEKAGKPEKSEKKDAKKARRSRDLDAEARPVGLGAASTTSPNPTDLSADTAEVAAVDRFPTEGSPSSSAEVSNASSGEDLVQDEVPASSSESIGDRKTAVVPVPGVMYRAEADRPPRPAAVGKPNAPNRTVSGSTSIVPASGAAGLHPSAAPHDPGIVTTQAIRVVVWRDGNGVHLAPEGTVVSAIKVSAVLVALEPNADLTAWLSERGRRT